MKTPLLVLLLAVPCLAAEPTLRESLAGVLAGGDVDEARIEQVEALFDGAPRRGDGMALAHLDAAAALADAGRLDLAGAHLAKADLTAERDVVRVAARFNLGQVRYKLASAMLKPAEGGQPDLEGAKAMLRRAADAFRSVLDIDPGDLEAARDVERVRRLIGAIEQMQEQAKKQADQMRKQADQLDQLADRQQQESAQNQQQTQQPQQAQQDQSDINEDTAKQSELTQQSRAQQALQDAMEQQKKASERLEKGDQQAASESQKKAAEKLRESAQALREAADKQEGKRGEQNDQKKQGEQGEKPDEKNNDKQEGESRDDRLTKWLLDREQRQREHRDQQLKALLGRPVPVEKDW